MGQPSPSKLRLARVPRYRMLIEYDGSPFCGWQVQPDQPSVQAAIEDALEVVLKHRPQLVGSGRTDAGVHARGQVAHFDASGEVDEARLRRSLNGLLPQEIVIRALERTTDDFHARYEARLRRYHYYVSVAPFALDFNRRWLLRPPPDFDLMNLAGTALLGRHDFDSFCRTQSATKNRVCTIGLARWAPEPDFGACVSRWRFEVTADRFLHGMVRTIVGTLVEIGRGQRSPAALREVLDARDRREAGPAAPPEGLVLEHVDYDRPFAPHSFDMRSIAGAE